MDDAAFRDWWKLHLRVSRGETLGAEEADRYRHGVEVLDEAERQEREVSVARKLRALLKETEASHARLSARQAQLAAEITRIEASLTEETRWALGITD